MYEYTISRTVAGVRAKRAIACDRSKAVGDMITSISGMIKQSVG
jgi:hypothetical protein